MMWLASVLLAELDAFAARTDNAMTLDIDTACADPVGVLRGVANRLGTPWGDSNEAALRALDRRQGKGFNSTRETKSVPGYWRNKLSASEVKQIEEALMSVGVNHALGEQGEQPANGHRARDGVNNGARRSFAASIQTR
jgi:hypothetical protein